MREQKKNIIKNSNEDINYRFYSGGAGDKNIIRLYIALSMSTHAERLLQVKTL